MAELTQRRFATLLGTALKAMDLTAAEVSRRTAADGGRRGIDRSTMVDYLKPTHHTGPPKRETRARLERAIDLPEGYLDGDVEIDLTAWRKTRRQLVAERAVRYPIQEIVDEPAESSGLDLGDEDEDHLRDLLHDAVRTVTGHAKQDRPSARRWLLLGALSAYEHSLRLAGKKVPPYFATIRSEIERARFR